MTLPLYQLDAFTSRLFGGNPAAVVLLEAWLPDVVLQSIAAENNLAETAFAIPDAQMTPLRWFTPAVARQVSARGGELRCELRGDRVGIAGSVVEYLRGQD